MPGHYNRTDLMDSSRLPGEAGAETQGEASARAEVVAGTPSPRPARLPVVRPSERPDEPVQAGLPMGPGPGSYPLPSRGVQTLDVYRALVRKTRDPVLAVLVSRLAERQQRGMR